MKFKWKWLIWNISFVNAVVVICKNSAFASTSGLVLLWHEAISYSLNIEAKSTCHCWRVKVVFKYQLFLRENIYTVKPWQNAALNIKLFEEIIEKVGQDCGKSIKLVVKVWWFSLIINIRYILNYFHDIEGHILLRFYSVVFFFYDKWIF